MGAPRGQHRPDLQGLRLRPGQDGHLRQRGNGTTLFYLGRIEAVHAGKTMVIQLFDPGDASGNSSIQILQPTSPGYTPATFSYTADSNATGSRAART